MSNRSNRRKALQNVPDISFFGDELDRVLNGAVTPQLMVEVRKELPKEEPKPESQPVFQIVPRLPPIVIIMQESICNCGTRSVSFGYFAKMMEESTDTGTVRRFTFIEKPYETPHSIKYETRHVPYCQTCIPNGLNRIS